MNYRTLLIISLLILFVGIAGIMFLPSGDETPAQQVAEQVEPEKKVEEKLILVAQLKRDVNKGRLLQAEDYALNEMTVTVDSPLVSNDVRDLAINNSLQGFLVAENLVSGSFLSPKTLLSPNDSGFYTASLNPNQEVAYRVYIRPEDAYILTTVSGGDYVSVFNQQLASDSRNSNERKNLIKVAPRVLVLQSKTFPLPKTDDDEGNVRKPDDGFASDMEYVGFIALKVTGAQAKNFYSLDKDSKLVVLPAENTSQYIDSRGTFIRKLRGL